MIQFSTEYYSEECNGIKLNKYNYNERQMILNSQKEFFSVLLKKYLKS